MTSTEYRVGPLFPRKKNGDLNLVLSGSLEVITKNGKQTIQTREDPLTQNLNTELSITSDPIDIPGTNRFLNQWLIPQLQDTKNDNSIFNQIK